MWKSHHETRFLRLSHGFPSNDLDTAQALPRQLGQWHGQHLTAHRLEMAGWIFQDLHHVASRWDQRTQDLQNSWEISVNYS